MHRFSLVKGAREKSQRWEPGSVSLSGEAGRWQLQLLDAPNLAHPPIAGPHGARRSARPAWRGKISPSIDALRGGERDRPLSAAAGRAVADRGRI